MHKQQHASRSVYGSEKTINHSQYGGAQRAQHLAEAKKLMSHLKHKYNLSQQDIDEVDTDLYKSSDSDSDSEDNVSKMQSLSIRKNMGSYQYGGCGCEEH
jgi:hypothetical protein